MPEGYQAIQVSFSSPTLGDFEETFEFQVDGAPQNLKLTFRWLFNVCTASKVTL